MELYNSPLIAVSKDGGLALTWPIRWSTSFSCPETICPHTVQPRVKEDGPGSVRWEQRTCARSPSMRLNARPQVTMGHRYGLMSLWRLWQWRWSLSFLLKAAPQSVQTNLRGPCTFFICWVSRSLSGKALSHWSHRYALPLAIECPNRCRFKADRFTYGRKIDFVFHYYKHSYISSLNRDLSATVKFLLFFSHCLSVVGYRPFSLMAIGCVVLLREI